MDIKKFVAIMMATVALFSCKKQKSAAETEEYNRGRITVVTDDSFKSVTQALAEAYMINYPETKISVKVQKEDLGFLDLLKGKVKLAVMSRELTPEEIAEYERVVDLKYEPAKFAADGVLFVVPKNSERSQIAFDDIKKGLQDGSTEFIFDGTNSGNLNFVAQKLGVNPSSLKFRIINGNKNLIEHLSEYPNAVGVIGLNAISRPYGTEATELRNMIKILSVAQNGKTTDASLENLRSMAYPFTRIVYFLSTEGGFQIASGLIRFSGTQLGQMVVEKEGLAPYNLYKREVQMR